MKRYLEVKSAGKAVFIFASEVRDQTTVGIILHAAGYLEDENK